MSIPQLPVTHRPTGLGTTAADVARLLSVYAVSPTTHDEVAADITALATPADRVLPPHEVTPVATSPTLTEFDRSLQRLIRTPSEPVPYDRAQNLQQLFNSALESNGIPTDQAVRGR
ncbi:hypothetical protein ACW9HQ_50250, partial [Nocardia gipuzkoensis]